MKWTLVVLLTALFFLPESSLFADKFTISEITGSAKIKKKGGKWKELNADAVFEKGDQIKTEGKSTVLLLSKSKERENQIRVKPQSELFCENPGNNEEVPTFGLERGSAYFSIDSKVKKSGITFKIKTRVGVAGVKGTKFLVENNPVGMRVAVKESVVELTDENGNRAVDLTPNEIGYIQPWEQAEFRAQGVGMCPTPPKGTLQMLNIVFPPNVSDSEMFSAAQVEFMRTVERLVQTIPDPSQRSALQNFDRVQFFDQLLPKIQKVTLADGQVELRMPLNPIMEALGLPGDMGAFEDVRPLDKNGFGQMFGGVGRLRAERAARVDAMRNMVEMIKGVVVEGNTTIKDFVAESDQISAALDTYVRGINVQSFEYFSDGMVQANVYIDPRIANTKLGNILQKPMGDHMMRASKGLSPELLGAMRD